MAVAAFINQLGRLPPTTHGDPALRRVLCSANDEHNFLTYEMLSMLGTHLLLHILHCACSGFNLHLYVRSIWAG